MISRISESNTSFTGFAKFSGNYKHAKTVAQKVKENLPNSFVFSDKKISKDKTYYIITGKHKNKFIKLIRKNNSIFLNIKQNIEKYMDEKAKKLKIKKLEKLLDNNKKLEI